jgi:hypothetical protein
VPAPPTRRAPAGSPTRRPPSGRRCSRAGRQSGRRRRRTRWPCSPRKHRREAAAAAAPRRAPSPSGHRSRGRRGRRYPSGFPASSTPPMTCGTPPKPAIAASARGAGSAEALSQSPKLPSTVARVPTTSAVGCPFTRPPTMYRFSPDCTALPSARGRRERQLLGAPLPGDERTDRRRARQRLVAGVAPVDGAERVVADVDRGRDGRVVHPVRDVAEQQDDQPEPEQGLEEGRRPAVRVEQAEERPSTDRAGGQGSLGQTRSLRCGGLLGYGWIWKSPCIGS